MGTWHAPAIHDDDYDRFRADETAWMPAVREICARHGLDAARVEPQATGTAVVCAVGETVVKLYCPLWPEEFERERRGLAQWRDGLALPVPRLLATGDLDGWPYAVMTRLPGVMLRTVWKEMAADARAGILRRAGGIMAGLHRAPVRERIASDESWEAFTRGRVAAFANDQRKRGIAPAWIAPLQERLEEGLSELADGPFPLLHCDLHWDHFLVAREAGAWRITGLIDFADAMVGHPLYEFGAPLAYLGWGDLALRRELLLGYGFAAHELTPALSRRLFTALLLHRYLSVARCVETLAGRIRDPEAFEANFCGL